MKIKRRNSQARQKQIIEACRKVIIKYGSENVTISRIAKETGITEGAIYRHFRSKKEVLSGLADLVVLDLINDIQTLEISGTSSPEEVEQILKRHIVEIKHKKGTSFQVIAEVISLGDKKLNDRIYKNIQIYVDILGRIIVAGIKSSKRRRDLDVEAAAMLLFGMIQGMINIWTLSRYSFDIQIMFSRLWRIFKNAIEN